MPKSATLTLPSLQNHNVVGLDIPVDNAPAVGVLQRLGDLGCMKCSASRQESLPHCCCIYCFSVSAVDELHNDVVQYRWSD